MATEDGRPTGSQQGPETSPGEQQFAAPKPAVDFSQAADRDHTAAERDHAAAERDQAATERDRSQADADQRSSRRDHAAADRDHAAAERDESQGDADQRSASRAQAATDRDQAASDRGLSRAATDQRSTDRDYAATDRGYAVVDRVEAADRIAATLDREQARARLQHPRIDGFSNVEDAVEFIGNVLEASTEYSLIATDADGVILLWNEGARRLYGHSPEEVIGRCWAVLHTEQDVRAGRPRELTASALALGKWEGEVTRVRKDGSEFTAREVTTPRRGTDRDPGGFLSISSDITEQVQMTQNLERAQAYSRSLIEFAPDAMVIVNVTGEIQLANAETERLFGYPREQLIGRPVEMLIPQRHQARHPSHRGAFFHAPRSRLMGAGLELSGRRQDGTEFPVEISLSPTETDEGVFATAAIRDVSERQRAERLGDANIQLRAADRAKDRFLASMSHELRTPLNAILGFTGTLLMELPGPLNEEQTKQLRTVQVSSKHLLSLINDLLDLGRIESGTIEFHFEAVDCHGLLEEVAVGLRPLATAKGLELEVLAPPVPLEIQCDRRAVIQILINLANNAIKFTDEGRIQLKVSGATRDDPAVARLSVIDTGCGIKHSDQKTLFAAFEQIRGATGRPYEGTGLGLYICQTLATAMGAKIGFDSEVGVGSTFFVEIGAK